LNGKLICQNEMNQSRWHFYWWIRVTYSLVN